MFFLSISIMFSSFAILLLVVMYSSLFLLDFQQFSCLPLCTLVFLAVNGVGDEVAYLLSNPFR